MCAKGNYSSAIHCDNIHVAWEVMQHNVNAMHLRVHVHVHVRACICAEVAIHRMVRYILHVYHLLNIFKK